MTISDPRAEVAGQRAVEGLGAKLTDKIDDSKLDAYFDEIRKYLPSGFEEQIWHAGVHAVTNSYCGWCFMTDIDAKVCAENILEKLGAK